MSGLDVSDIDKEVLQKVVTAHYHIIHLIRMMNEKRILRFFLNFHC